MELNKISLYIDKSELSQMIFLVKTYLYIFKCCTFWYNLQPFLEHKFSCSYCHFKLCLFCNPPKLIVINYNHFSYCFVHCEYSKCTILVEDSPPNCTAQNRKNPPVRHIYVNVKQPKYIKYTVPLSCLDLCPNGSILEKNQK